MADKPGNPFKFWEELKRRNVHRSLAIYAGSAFVFLEAATIIFPRWGFPDWTIDLVLYLLILGAFITIIVSWIFDITSQGVQKTKPLDEIIETEKPADSKVWKAATYISLLIIVALIILNISPMGKTIKPGDINSLVILPFDNFTGDEQLDISISGMHAMLINDVGRISEIRVISKTTSNVYKDVDMTIPQIASERKVDALMEIGVLCMGDTICFQLKMVTPDEEQLWIAEYRVEKSQILNLNNEITRQIADEIMVELTPEEERLLDRDRTVDREAYDDYLRSNGLQGDLNLDSLNKAKDYLNSAIEKDPDWAPLYSGLANVWIMIQQAGYEPTSVTSPEIYKNVDKALELDPNLSEAHASRALIAYLMEWDWEKSEKEFIKALAVNPNDATSRVLYGQLLCTLQRTYEGIAQGRLALELDPLNPNIKVWYGAILLCAGDCKTVLALGEEITASDPGHIMANSLIEAAAFQCKEYDKMIKAVRYLYRMVNVKEEGINEIERIYRKQGIVKAYEKIMKHMEEYSENNNVSPISMAATYIMANQPHKAMDWVEKGFEQRDPKMPTIASIFIEFEPLFNNPRFIAICKKMNLPLPED